MQSHHNTSIYKTAVDLYKQINRICHHKINLPLFFQLESEAINLTTDIALSIDQDSKKEQDTKLQKSLAHFNRISQLIQLALEQKQISQHDSEKIAASITVFRNQVDYFINHRPTILILSSIFGQGHMSAAKAIKEGFENLYGKNYNVVIIDFVEEIGTFLNKTTLSAYENSTKYAPQFYKAFFDSTDSQWQVKLFNILNYPLSAKKLEKLFQSYNPTLTISTFPVWDYLASMVLKTCDNQKFISIVTDSISIHSVWMTGNPDYHIVANQETAESLYKLGARTEKVQVLGFPVKLSFAEKPKRQEILKSLNLDPKKFTVLYLPASKPLSTSRRIKEIQKMHPDINLIVVCGRNKELLPKLRKFKNEKNICILGWTNQLPEIMKSSDVVVTKAGGATVMECIAAKKPMVITQVIPGQELGNAELIEIHKLGIIKKRARKSIAECIEIIKKHQHSYQRHLKRISKPQAALAIAKFIQSQID